MNTPVPMSIGQPTISAPEGAKPAFVVPQDEIDDLLWLQVFLANTVKDLK